MADRPVRLVLPHQLFETHLDAPAGTTFVLVEHDLLFRQYRFHRQKLVLHRASMVRFAERLRGRGHEVEHLRTDAATTSRAALAGTLRALGATEVGVHDVVDDWLGRDLVAAVGDAGLTLSADDVRETPNFLTTRAQLAAHFEGRRPRMSSFYEWQRRRLDVLMDGDGPVGGRWSFDEDNRRKLPRNHPVPEALPPDRHPAVDDAIAWVDEAFPDNPGNAAAFAWPTSHAEASAGLEQFLAERFHEFGPYEDALSTEHPFLFHSLLTPGLNIGLLSPRHVLTRALEVGRANDVPIASVEGFVRQVIGWREYMRATYVLHGRRLRSRNHLAHARPLAPGWWTAETGLAPVDHVVGRVLENGYAHHIERLMVLGNAMALLRTDPEAVHEWFMEMFVDAYDWVMVPNVHAMSQFSAGAAITTKPYVSGSNYLRKMGDYGSAGWGSDWAADWDALYWTFVRDHREVFEGNARAHFVTSAYDRMDAATKAVHSRRAKRWLS
ncbi:cryptochrome/photolyase family protein [Nocardioides sp. 1609]|uniref:cryptochrome/photolyase family protein n=1 Tax=Nocardioides sp. 1609 TaxID=2508327 RepID=UPI00106F3951|nr:cryptochrome/photolyase family protein [Nocardioides sp. 1609]